MRLKPSSVNTDGITTVYEGQANRDLAHSHPYTLTLSGTCVVFGAKADVVWPPRSLYLNVKFDGNDANGLSTQRLGRYRAGPRSRNQRAVVPPPRLHASPFAFDAVDATRRGARYVAACGEPGDGSDDAD